MATPLHPCFFAPLKHSESLHRDQEGKFRTGPPRTVPRNYPGEPCTSQTGTISSTRNMTSSELTMHTTNSTRNCVLQHLRQPVVAVQAGTVARHNTGHGQQTDPRILHGGDWDWCLAYMALFIFLAYMALFYTQMYIITPLTVGPWRQEDGSWPEM